MIQRGDVVMVDFPYTDTARSKVRPAVVVLNDRDNHRLRKTVVAMITGNLRRRGDPSHLFIDPAVDPSHAAWDVLCRFDCRPAGVATNRGETTRQVAPSINRVTEEWSEKAAVKK